MRRRQKCVQCGNDCDPDVVKYRKERNWTILCKACHQKEREAFHANKRAQRLQEVKQLYGDRRCVVCGKPIPWKDTYLLKYPNNWPLTCSGSCHGAYSKRDAVLSKETIERRLREAIRELGPVTYKEVVTKAHIAAKVLTKHKICVSTLMKEELGIEVKRVDYTCKRVDPGIRRDALNQKYGFSGSLKDFVHFVVHDKSRSFEEKQKVLTDCVRCLITEADTYIGVVRTMRLLGIAYEQLVGKYKIDVSTINRNLGYVNKRQSWFEETAYSMLCDAYGKTAISREHSFSDCRSGKGFPLRYDFYIPSCTCLIEIDGTQHTDQRNKFYTADIVENDRIKDAYAASHGYRLYRIAAEPSRTFQERFQKILGVLKPVELLEPRPDNAEGNQQPSP